MSANSVGAVRNVSTSADEKAAPPPPELSENERKLSSEIESLSKDVETFKEKISDLDVCLVFCMRRMSSVLHILFHFTCRTSTNVLWLTQKT